MGKHLLITAGTVAAGVGQEFLRQMNIHSMSTLDVKVRYLDTSWLPDEYSAIQGGEWFHLNTDNNHMKFVERSLDNHPRMKKLWYPGLRPATDGNGGSNIRYNTAGAIEIVRDDIKDWIKSSLTDLANSGDQMARISIAIVISAVGATGSGTLERLIDLTVEAAYDAGISSPIRCDVFILQPGAKGTNDLLLANTLALYAEMAASRMAGMAAAKSYRGRTVMIGWGSELKLSSIQQLKETAATIIRLTTDTTSGVAAEHQGRLGDRHVLLEPDSQTGLPSHLSTVTPITITLSDLSNQVLQADVARVIHGLTLGTQDVLAQHDEESNALFVPIGFLKTASNTNQAYRDLLAQLASGVMPASMELNAAQIAKFPAGEQGTVLRQAWLHDKEDLARQGRPRIQNQARVLASTIIRDLEQTQRTLMGGDYTLLRLLKDYQGINTALAGLSREAGNYTPRPGADETTVLKRLAELDNAHLFNRQQAIRNALDAVHGYLTYQLEQEAHRVARVVIRAIEAHCADAMRVIRTVVQYVQRERDKQPRWGSSDPVLSIAVDHPFHIPALSTPQQMQHYYDTVSLFAAEVTDARGIINSIDNGDSLLDPLADFRQWLITNNYMDDLFKGEPLLLLKIAQTYVQEHLQERVKRRSVLDVLLEAGEHVLQQRLAEANKKAYSTVGFSEAFSRKRKEASYVSTKYTDAQRTQLNETIAKTFGQGEWALLQSQDPTEMVVLHYIDGLPMSAIKDLTGTCLDAFLARRASWYRQQKSKSNQYVGVPIYSGRDAEERVKAYGIIRTLYGIKGESVGDYTSAEVPELADSDQDLERFEPPQSQINNAKNGLQHQDSNIEQSDLRPQP